MIRKRTLFRILRNLLLGLIVLIAGFAAYFSWRVRIPFPDVDGRPGTGSFTRVQAGPDHYQVNNCWIKKNRFGVWEMYIEGEDYERGVIYGILAKELIQYQEECFVNQINELVPNTVYRTILKYFVAWFNRDIYKHIPAENLREIYGISLSFSDKYDFIGKKYYRILNYHAAHDIGHALNDYNLVGCTSFAVTRECSADSCLLIGRNFDFYLGDDFARDKLLLFVNPTRGYKFASYSWAGLSGVVSGMNEKGLTVTLNASRSDIPFASKEPISILAREILQYAGTIDEALAIASKKETFVSESLLIGSAADHEAAVIEKSQTKMDVYRSTVNRLICSNHYQSPLFMNDSINLENIRSSDSKYRFDRVSELLDEAIPLTTAEAASILRNRQGANEKFIGLGNPKSINQLIAHHSVIFKPERRMMWISTPPYQLGEFICYDFGRVFTGGNHLADSLNIEQDPFVSSEDFSRFESCKTIRRQMKKHVLLGIPFNLDGKSEEKLIISNPECYTTYMDLGDYFLKRKEFEKAQKYYKEALRRDVASRNVELAIDDKIRKCESNLNK